MVAVPWQQVSGKFILCVRAVLQRGEKGGAEFLMRWVTEEPPFPLGATEVFSRSMRLIISCLRISWYSLEKYILRKKGRFTAAFHALCCCAQTQRHSSVKGEKWGWCDGHTQWHPATKWPRNDTLKWCRMSINWLLLCLKYCKWLHIMYCWEKYLVYSSINALLFFITYFLNS